jgi:hypothetical protein
MHIAGVMWDSQGLYEGSLHNFAKESKRRRKTELEHIYEFAKRTPQQPFEGNMTRASVVITVQIPLTKYQTITFIRNSRNKSHDSPLTSSTVGVDK